MSAFTCRPHSPFAALSRTRCPDCDGQSLAWTSALDLAWGIEPAERRRLFDLIDFVGPGADAWRCIDCGDWGVFDPLHDR